MADYVPKRKRKTGSRLSPEERKLSRKKKKELQAKQKAAQLVAKKAKAGKKQGPVLTQAEIEARALANIQRKTQVARQQAIKGEAKYLLGRYKSIIAHAHHCRDQVHKSVLAHRQAAEDIKTWEQNLQSSKKHIQEFYARLSDFDNGVSHSIAHKDLEEGEKVGWKGSGLFTPEQEEDAYGEALSATVKGRPVKIKQLYRNDLSAKLLKEEVETKLQPEAEDIIDQVKDEVPESETPEPEVVDPQVPVEGTTAQEAMA